MIKIDDLQLIGSGATANVYLYDNNKIIKLFNNDYDINAVNYEAKIAQEINDSCITAPKFYQTIIINGQNGIVYEFVEGELLFSLLLKSSLPKGIKLIKKLAQTQISINQKRNNNITSQIDRFSYLINKSTGIESYKDVLIEGLKSIKQDNCICHGDLHAGNIIVNSSGYVPIDWMNCYAGNKEGDLIRSYLMLVSPYIPFQAGRIIRILFRIYKNILGHVYMKEYLKLTKLKKKELRKWYSIIAASRLADNVPNEEQWLIKIIRKNINYLKNYLLCLKLQCPF